MICNAPFCSFKCKDNKSAVCCNDDYIVNDNNEFYTNNKLRENILTNNYKGTHCEKCTLRFLYDNPDKFEKKIINDNILEFCNGTNNYKITFADITLGHNCNNDCIICQKFKDNFNCKYTVSKNNEKIIKENADNITRCILMGGESFLYINEMRYWIKQFSNLKFLSIVTNGSILDEKFIKELNNMNIDVNITFSIDGTKYTNSYMRKYSNYDNVMNNVKTMLMYNNINIGFNVTVSILNCLDIYRVLADINKYVPVMTKKIPVTVSKLIYPYYYSLDYVESEYIKNECLSQIQSAIECCEKLNIHNDIGNIYNLKAENSKDMINIMLKYYDNKFKCSSKDYLHPETYNYIYGCD